MTATLLGTSVYAQVTEYGHDQSSSSQDDYGPDGNSNVDSSLHTVDGVPLYIDGRQTRNVPARLSPALLDQVRTVTTLGDALRILGPAYIAPDDSLHIPHYHFQNGIMLTVWPQGGETLNDPVTVSPRPDCGMPADSCTDLLLARKKSQSHRKQHGGNSSGGGGGGASSLMSPLMQMFHGR